MNILPFGFAPRRTTPTPGSHASRGASVRVAGLTFAAAMALAACSSGTTTPSIPATIPSIDVNGDVNGGASAGASLAAACLDPATMAIFTQLTAPGADIPTILQQNKAALTAGLGRFHPADAATAKWRDDLISALDSGDMTTAATLMQQVASGTVKVTGC